ncbi:gastrula zinc finger protein XlCGF28.1-like [Silurus asotus]|uniref:Gastrula zinc finger protein XlCGF28.1-like n=1 Tax=Silurus asotus TaxID=30991 RepID=A0AAD5ADI9_SILAS|nr:gastrula zinc finger protein XlCGF28.1-like [Silurus asotus]
MSVKCFERLVMRHIKTQLPPAVDPMQFAYGPNRSTDDAISTTLHLAITHLDNKDSHVRMLFIDFSSAFNTIIPQHLIEKLSLLGLNTSLFFLTERPQRTQSDHSPLIIDGSSVEIVKSTKFLGVHLAGNLTWLLNTSSITKKAQHRLYFLRRLRKAHLPPPILTMFYRGTIESILSSCITAWLGNCTVSDCKTLQRIVRTAEKIIGVSLPSIMDIYTTRCIRKANSSVDDHTHPSDTLFTLLLSGKRHSGCHINTVQQFFPASHQAPQQTSELNSLTHTLTHTLTQNCVTDLNNRTQHTSYTWHTQVSALFKFFIIAKCLHAVCC